MAEPTEVEPMSICRPGGRGMLLPLIDGEQTWPDSLRGVLYGIAMVYCFLGVSIIADTFMASIEAITRRRRKVKGANGKHVTVKVWNDTVATLSLMALGSSAPEICLSAIELLKKGFHVGELGPSTIVGSAAFNLLVIVAICIIAIPAGEVRLIQELPVFYVTAVFSLAAYAWLVFILTMNTVDVVDIWEAVATLLMGPLFVYVAYKSDRGTLSNAGGKLLAFLGRGPGQALESPSESLSEEASIRFMCERLTLQHTDQPQTLEVTVTRSGDCEVASSCLYRTEPMSAVPGFDYEEAEGTLDFSPGKRQCHIQLEILPRSRPHRQPRELLLILEDIEGPVEFSSQDDGGTDSAILTVALEDVSDSKARHIDALVNVDGLHRSCADWRAMSSDVLYCNGGYEEQQEASAMDWFFHALSLPWKIMFLAVPPTSFFGGWLCFTAALVVIALLTAVLSDLAELFGCVLGVPDIVTAVSFVALGTSMPDLFASLAAAKEDPTADASVVNVTGSNAVNVFLGLGLPWTMGAVFWSIRGREGTDWAARYPEVAAKIPSMNAAFVVDSRNLGFQVLVFMEACLGALLILFLRRRYLGAELGGPFWPKVSSCFSFVAMWLGFIYMTSWRVLRFGDADDMESTATMGGTAIVEGIIAVWPVVTTVCNGRRGLAGHATEKAESLEEGAEVQENAEACDVVADSATAGIPSAALQHGLSRSQSGSVSEEGLALQVRVGTRGGVVVLGAEVLAEEAPPNGSSGQSMPPKAINGNSGVGRSVGFKAAGQNSPVSTGAVSLSSTQPSVSEELPSSIHNSKGLRLGTASGAV